MGKLVTILLSCCIASLTHAQDSLWQLSLQKQLITNAVTIEKDNLHNVYLINKEGQIKKLNANLDSVGLFNNVRQYGTIYSLDATNSLKLLVYYKEFATILVLDRFLNVKNTISLRQQNIFQCSAIALSYDNMIWVYDDLEQKIKKLNDNGTVVFESTDLRLVVDGIQPPNQFYDVDGKLYFFNETNGLLCFDYYGAIKNNFGVQQVNGLGLVGNSFLSINPQKIQLQQLNTFSYKTYNLPTPLQNATKLCLGKGKLAALKNNTLYIYNYTLNEQVF